MTRIRKQLFTLRILTSLILCMSFCIIVPLATAQEPPEECPCTVCITMEEAQELGLDLCRVCEDERMIICGYTDAGIAKYCAELAERPFKIIFGSARSNHVDRPSDIQSQGVSGLKGYTNATVFLNGWDFDFHDSDHHINEIGIRLTDIHFDQIDGSLSWVAEVDYADKNFDDEFVWTYWYVVVAFNEGGYFEKENSGSDDGGRTDFSDSVGPLAEGVGENTILQRGTKFDFQSDDHDINELSVRILNEDFNPPTRILNWNTTLDYADQNFDDDYDWWLWYAAFSSPNMVKILGRDDPVINSCDGGQCGLTGESVSIPTGYDYAVVFLRGWKFDYTNEDHHLDEVGIRIENQEFDPDSQTLSWNVVVDYFDKNADDDYEWQYWYTVLGFQSAEVVRQENQPSMGLPEPLVLEETIYVDPNSPRDIDRDQDRDRLKDDLEGELAEHFKPYYQFDSAEAARRPIEPVTIFQVRPVGCSGLGCGDPTLVRIRWAWLFQEDGGYGPAEGSGFWDGGFCTEGCDAHSGDNAYGDYELESIDGGITWVLTRIYKETAHEPIEWTPGSSLKLEVHDRSHPVIYMSAHKHHEYLNNEWNHKDSPYSDVFLFDDNNDDVDGNGDFIIPDLHSHFIDSRFNNVGEPENHSPEFFVNQFTEVEFPGESAWGEDNFYDVHPNIEIWMQHGFTLP